VAALRPPAAGGARHGLADPDGNTRPANASDGKIGRQVRDVSASETTGLIHEQTHLQVDPKAATRRPDLPISRCAVLYRRPRWEPERRAGKSVCMAGTGAADDSTGDRSPPTMTLL